MKNPKVGEREWRTVEGFPDYMISNDGELLSLHTKAGKILKGGLNPSGYRTATITRRGKSIFGVRHHQLVARAFIGPRPIGMVINHKDGVKTNNHVDNLEYCTPKENRDHAKIHRLYVSGTRCSWSKLSEEAVMLARKCYETGMSFAQLARAFGVSKRAMQFAIKGKSWAYAEKDIKDRSVS